ncbi:MAG: NfeD family protein [Gallionella sp.]|jgi:membrane protein implicated in regulation of membrane protease activity|nr:NfeD family protein [Gallionella sp.]
MMEHFNYWFLLALILLALEMATGTFYMLVLSVAMAVAGFAAMLSVSLAWQFALCALAVMSGLGILRVLKAPFMPDQSSMDVGQPVEVLVWHDNGSARVFYRGAEWDAELASADLPHQGTFYISAVQGATLILTHQKL